MTSAYCWPQSAVSGEPIELMISSAATTADVEVVRIGADDVVVARFDGIETAEHPIPTDVGLHGCGWPATLTLTVDPKWQSGFYLVRVHDGSGTPTEAFFVVRASEPGDVLLVLATTTYAAYNDWQAPSFYTGGHRSSQLRPLPRGFLDKPDPERYRLANMTSLPRDERRAHFVDYSMWSGAAGFANWERLFVRWAEREGIAVDYATSYDLATRPTLLEPYRAYVSVGHDEYWTASMRDAVEQWVDGGGAAIFLSGNTAFWQIRLDDDGRQVVGYKLDFELDPVLGTADETSLSTMWSDPLVGRPESEMTGVTFTRGGYAHMRNAPQGSGGYTVCQPDHWVFDGIDVRTGDIVGAEPIVVGYECDGCELELVDGVPHATGSAGTPANFVVLGTAPAHLWETAEGAPGLADDWIGELNWVAERIGGGDTAENRAKFAHGHAVMGTYERGDGWVFTAGCTDWAYGLGDAAISRITRNLFNRALR